ncbi:hypothetical protein NDU88_001683 [Pleurodeles waltl]|uniref:Reverse transcriptase domain-containing protein n=1 Tax=Pleurodeles waltl TaxID=8319 RepID=A0AAV7S8B8_PLEWA|nr:hypothetical protein NDU88_001683 [Pleurodeles waltl]
MFVPTLPPDNHIDVFYQAVSTELYNLEDKKRMSTHRPSNNLNSDERRALHKLSMCPDIVIMEADKGGNVVVMNRSDYVAEIDRQLNDTQAYSLLPSNPLPNITNMIRKKLAFWKNHCLLTDLEHRFLYIEAPRAPCIYILPKVHKPGGFPPGRPIISGIGSPTEHISEYIDSFLQPLVHNLPSYIQDTRDLLCQLEDIDWSEDFMFVCLDVSSLYTSIPLERGLEMLQRTLSTRDATLHDHTRMLLDLTRLVLENNVFLHDSRWFRQCQGVAMGAKFSPSYANLYMGQFEKIHLWSNCPSHLTEHILYWGRYIDDILAIWTGNASDLNILFEHLNTNDFNLVFTHKVDTTKIEFLDLLLYITNNKIMSRLYRKPTACNSVLHAHSAHPLSQIRAIPYSEMVRIRRNCTDNDVATLLAEQYTFVRVPDCSPLRFLLIPAAQSKHFKGIIDDKQPRLYKTPNYKTERRKKTVAACDLPAHRLPSLRSLLSTPTSFVAPVTAKNAARHVGPNTGKLRPQHNASGCRNNLRNNRRPGTADMAKHRRHASTAASPRILAAKN